MPNQEKLEIKYYKAVGNKLKSAMEQKKMTQAEIIKKCKEHFGLIIGQSTVSKILNSDGQSHMSLIYVSAICQVLSVNMGDILSFQDDDPSSIVFSHDNTVADTTLNSHHIDNVLIGNPTHSAFQGYVDKDFDIFFYPTISTESEMISGTLCLSNIQDEYCKAQITLNIPSANNHPKEYTGKMLISLPHQACYCTVVSESLGEVCSIVFHHRFFYQSSLKVRMAVVSTVCAGDSRRPTMHRMVICEKDLIKDDEKKQEFIKSQLLLNSSQIVISEESFNQFKGNDKLAEILKSIATRNNALQTYYVFEESDIIKLPNFSFIELADVISFMRKKSISMKYNKVGAKSDELLYKYLFLTQ